MIVRGLKGHVFGFLPVLVVEYDFCWTGVWEIKLYFSTLDSISQELGHTRADILLVEFKCISLNCHVRIAVTKLNYSYHAKVFQRKLNAEYFTRPFQVLYYNKG